MKEKSKLSLFIQGSALLIISNICIKAINFFLLPLYTAHLTPSMLGVSDSITTFTGILFPILVLGLDSAYSAFYFDEADRERAKKVFATIGFALFAIGMIPILLCLLSGPLSLLIFQKDEYRLVVLVALIGVTMNLWSLPFSLELRLQNRMGRFGAVSVITSLTMVLLNILFVSVMKMGEMALILSSTIVLAEGVFLYGGFTGSLPRLRFFDRALLKKMLAFSLPLIPSVLMAWVLSLSDRYILLYNQGDAAVGLYGIGARFVLMLNVVITAVNTAYTTFAFSSKDDENAKKQFYYVFTVVSLILLAIVFTVSIFGKEIVWLMADHEYYSSYVIIRDMMFGQLLYAVSTFVSYGIIFEKKSVYSMISVSAGAIVNLALNFIFIPKYGIVAAALTTLVGYLVSLVLTYIFSERLYPCYYGMGKLSLLMGATYALTFFSAEWSLWIRIGLWLVTAAAVLLLYRNTVRMVWAFIRGKLRPATGTPSSDPPDPAAETHSSDLSEQEKTDHEKDSRNDLSDR